MRTSNKILIAFFLVVFLIPLLMLMSFSNMIKNGKSTPAKDRSIASTSYRNGEVKPARFIKLLAPEGTRMRCNLHFAGKAAFSYNKDGQDSLKISNAADTLLIEYVAVEKRKLQAGDEFSGIHIELNHPGFNHLLAQNTAVWVYSTDTAAVGDLQIDLSNGGAFNAGAVENRFGEPMQNTPVLNFGKLMVRSENGKIALGPRFQAAQVDLRVSGTSKVSLHESAAIGELSGSISDSSLLDASWKHVKKLLPANP